MIPEKLTFSRLGECLIVAGFDNRVVITLQVDDHLILTKKQQELILTTIEKRYNAYADLLEYFNITHRATINAITAAKEAENADKSRLKNNLISLPQ